jgi:hypothetical protein
LRGPTGEIKIAPKSDLYRVSDIIQGGSSSQPPVGIQMIGGMQPPPPIDFQQPPNGINFNPIINFGSMDGGAPPPAKTPVNTVEITGGGDNTSTDANKIEGGGAIDFSKLVIKKV